LAAQSQTAFKTASYRQCACVDQFLGPADQFLDRNAALVAAGAEATRAAFRSRN